jgi:hypothetical protein
MLKSGDCGGQEDAEALLHSLETITEKFQPCEWRHCRLGNHRCSVIASGSGMQLITQSVHILPCSNSAMKGNNGTNRIPRYCCTNRHRISSVFHV